MKKLVLYKTEADMRAQMGAYPNVLTFDPIARTAEMDDGVSGSVTLKFDVRGEELPLDELGEKWDAIEIIAGSEA